VERNTDGRSGCECASQRQDPSWYGNGEQHEAHFGDDRPAERLCHAPGEGDGERGA
jgi:hypothetical protein